MKHTVRSYLYPHRFAFLFALGQVVFISALELLKPWPIKIVIDHVLGGKPLPWPVLADWSPGWILASTCAGLVSVYFLLGGASVLNNYTTIRIGQKMVHDLRRDLYSQLQRLSLSFHHRNQIGDLLYRVTADTLAIQTITMNGIFPVLSALVLLGGMFFIMARMDWYLTILALSVVPVMVAVIVVVNRRIESAATRARRQQSEVYSVVQRAMSAVRIIQAFTKEEDEQKRFMAVSQRSLAADLRLYTLQSYYSWGIDVVIASGSALVLWVGAQRVFSGSMTLGELVVFISYLVSLYDPINRMLQTYGLVQEARAGVKRVFEILDIERELKDGPRVFGESRAKGRISFERVFFDYVGGDPVLKEIDLQIEPGEKVAIVGASGAGKSTLVSLVPRFYDAQSGRVAIDGVDVREFQLQSLRRQIAMVLQPPLIFPITIRENIAYGRPEATLDEVISAARFAHIDEVIAKLPQQYETVVGEQGATLSEGQKQRLTIARAILRNARVLILDEPTSSVDTETEALIMESLETLMTGKTTLIIAHRLSTVRRVDRIIVLHQGEIVEQGNFVELIRGRGPFASLYRTQFGLYEEERKLRLIK
jgi:ATP-binding cassette subfamily B protein/subfamily B ATP-binding cassette protein MsbA